MQNAKFDELEGKYSEYWSINHAISRERLLRTLQTLRNSCICLVCAVSHEVSNQIWMRTLRHKIHIEMVSLRYGFFHVLGDVLACQSLYRKNNIPVIFPQNESSCDSSDMIYEQNTFCKLRMGKAFYPNVFPYEIPNTIRERWLKFQ